MIAQGINVVITHGNGPQVGFILRRSEIANGQVPTVPMDYAGADTQGAIGYMFQKALHNKLRQHGIDRQTVTLVTQLLVDRNDPAFDQPTKPVGSYMDEATAKAIAEEQGWHIVEDSGRGWRRVVPSPLPSKIIELDIINSLVDSGFILIACGGGGIPVIEDQDGNLQGVEAVIDKDIASAMLANNINADYLLISTSVPKVAIHFNTPEQKWLDKLTIDEANQLIEEGHFGKGSMEPKVQAAISFVENGGERAIITDPPNLTAAIVGEAGTQILP